MRARKGWQKKDTIRRTIWQGGLDPSLLAVLFLFLLFLFFFVAVLALVIDFITIVNIFVLVPVEAVILWIPDRCCPLRPGPCNWLAMLIGGRGIWIIFPFRVRVISEDAFREGERDPITIRSTLTFKTNMSANRSTASALRSCHAASRVLNAVTKGNAPFFDFWDVACPDCCWPRSEDENERYGHAIVSTHQRRTHGFIL
jgi:hypothetical protein